MLLPRVTGELRLTAGMARLAVLAACIVGVGMIRTHLTHERAWILVGFFYYAVSTAFVSPPGDVLAHSRGARSATMIEMLSAFALLTAYLSSFVDWHRSEPSVREDLG